ncbi:MAG: SIMPL domain-containing protein, partial [Gemmobacter sp.]
AEGGGIVFEGADPQPLEDRARAEAVADARRRAGVIAQAAGLALGPVVEITEGAAAAAPGVPMLRFADAAGLPGAPGHNAIGATVRIVFALSPP